MVESTSTTATPVLLNRQVLPVPYPESFDDIVVTGRIDLARHPVQVQVALCVHRLEAEVNNGGFHQFFLNSSAEIVPHTLHALSVIGAPRTKRLLEEAIAVAFPSGYPADPADIQAALADFDDVADELERLDSEFCLYNEPLTDLVNAYLAGSI